MKHVDWEIVTLIVFTVGVWTAMLVMYYKGWGPC